MIYINVIAAMQTFLFAFLLWRIGRDNVLNKLLAFLLLMLGINLFGNTLVLSNVLPPFLNIFFFLTQGVSLFIAPIIFYYLNLLSGKKTKLLHPLFLVSFLLFIYILYLGVDFSLQPFEFQKLYLKKLKCVEYPFEMKVFNWLFILLQHIYFTISWFRVYKFKKAIKDVFSTRSRTKNNFAFKFISLIWVLDMVLLFSYLILPIYKVQYVVIPGKTIIAFSFILYFVLEQNVIFNKESYEAYLKDIALLNIAIVECEDEKVAKDLDAQIIKETLVLKKMHLNPTVTIFDLSKEMNCSHRLISASINNHYQKTFSRLVNDLRVEEAKKLLKNNPKDLTMEGVGLESGFNSRASFYRVFKQNTKLTPMEFMNKYRVSQ